MSRAESGDESYFIADALNWTSQICVVPQPGTRRRKDKDFLDCFEQRPTPGDRARVDGNGDHGTVYQMLAFIHSIIQMDGRKDRQTDRCNETIVKKRNI